MKTKIHLNGDTIELGVDRVIRITRDKTISTFILCNNREGYYLKKGNSRIKVEVRNLYDFFLDTKENRTTLRLLIKNRT